MFLASGAGVESARSQWGFQQMNAEGNIYFTEGKVPLADRERFEAAEKDDPEGIAKRVAEMTAEIERMRAEWSE